MKQKCYTCGGTGKPCSSCGEYHPEGTMCPCQEARFQNTPPICPTCGGSGYVDLPEKAKVNLNFIIKKYVEFVKNLECSKYDGIIQRLDHATSGLATEAGELLSIMKKVKFYNKLLDASTIVEIKDELSDELHYLVMALNVLGIDLDEIIEINVAKLRARYPNGYNDQDAFNRDKVKEFNAIDQAANKEK